MTALIAHAPAVEAETALVHRIAQGDAAAFETMMRRYNQRLFRLARAALRSDAEAEDALQEAYLQAYRSMSGFRGDAPLYAWLSRLVLNECLGRQRRSTRRQNVVPVVSADSDIDVTSMADNEAEKPDDLIGRTQMRALLERKVDELPEAFRVVFVLRSVEELTAEETAQCLGVPVATVRTRHFRARALLREALAKEMDLAERDVFQIGGTRCDSIVRGVFARLAAARG